MQTRKRDQTRGVRGHAPLKNFKFKTSQMAINASKTANSGKFAIITSALKTKSYNLAPTLDQNLIE